MKRLTDRLFEYRDSDYYGFHMPGHKRNERIVDSGLPYGIDITEIEGFDDLHHAQGILLEAQKRAAAVFGAEETFFLVNGSTAGILSAVLGCTKKGDKVLTARHCHKSVHHAMYLNELVPRYVYPQFDGDGHMNGEILAADVERMLAAEPDIAAVVIVSPNYDGVVSDVRAISDTVHRYGIPLIVDEAHGAHFGFHPYFPERSNKLGADVVINSLHKTLPSLTQTALLHINGTYADRGGIRRYLDMLQTSSPSYVLMAGIDACIDWLEKDAGPAFEAYSGRLAALRAELDGLLNLRILTSTHYDRSKLVISVADTDMTSKELYWKLLNDYHLQMEMTAGTYVLAMTSVADTDDGFARLRGALAVIDGQTGRSTRSGAAVSGELPRAEQVYTPYEIERRRGEDAGEVLPWEQSIGNVSMEYAYLYPPGSPVIVPGERVNEEVVRLLHSYEEQKFQIEGIEEKGKIRVLRYG